MESLENQTCLKKMLNCVCEIESYCTDLTQQQLSDLKLLQSLYLNFTTLGAEAHKSNLKHPVFLSLSGFRNSDFDKDFASDTYALYNYIMNDLGLVKQTLKTMDTVEGSHGNHSLVS